MEIEKLRYFYETAKIEHVTKAAENLHIAQPALTKSIKSLEDELGVKLFYKTGRRIKLTKYGKFLKHKAEKILQEIDVLPMDIEKMTDMEKNTVSINVLAASTKITEIIIKFKKQNPDVIFKMMQKDGDTDSNITVTTNSVREAGYLKARYQSVIEEQIFDAAPKTSEIAKKDYVDLKDLRFGSFIALSGSRRFRPLCDAYCTYAGFKPQVVFESDSLIAVKNLISAGIGLSFWPQFSWGKLNNERIKLLKIRNPDCHREIIVYTNDENNSPMCMKFYHFLVSGLNKIKSVESVRV